MKTYLKVTFDDKERVKFLGAKWDPARKAWYVENVPDLMVFSAWIPELAEWVQTGPKGKGQSMPDFPPPKVAAPPKKRFRDLKSDLQTQRSKGAR